MFGKRLVLFFCFIIFQYSFVKAINTDSLLQQAQNINSHDSVRYNAYFQLAKIYLYSPTDSSFYFASKAFRYAKKMNSREKQGYVFSVIGNYYYFKESYSKAIDNYYHSLRLGEMTGSGQLKITALVNISSIYSVTEKPEEALKYLLEALSITEKNRLLNNLAPLYTNLSDAYIRLKQYDKAIKYAQKSSYLFLAKKDARLSVSYDNMGIAYLYLNKYDNALVYFRKSLQLANRQTNFYIKNDLYLNLAQLFEKTHHIDSAMFYAKKAEALSSDNQYLEGQVKANQILYDLFKKTGNNTKALEYYERYLDCVTKQDKDEQIAQIEKNIFIYKTNKKIQEDSLKQAVTNLQKDNKIKIHQAQIKQDKLLKIGLFALIIIALGFGLFAYNRFKVISYQHRLIEIKNKQTEDQKAIILHKNKELMDSINYAKRIQEGLLASDKVLLKKLKDYFVFFKPKDIVSGDFYWSTEYDNCFYLAICDSTGHGVPGAFMSLLNIALLSEAIKEKQITEPHLIFNEVRNRLVEIISADGHKDGFDGVLIKIGKNHEGLTLQYVAANNEPILVRNNQMVKLEHDRMPVGKSDETASFKLHTINIIEGDTLFLFTDGYADQFGGKLLKKFKRKHLNELLVKNSELSMVKQLQLLKDTFELWKADEEQVDDVCVVGIKF